MTGRPLQRFRRRRSVAAAAWMVLLSACTTAVAPERAERSGKVAFLGAIDAVWQVWVMNPDGTDPRQVTRSDYGKARISWYPDGGALLVNGLDGRLVKVALDSGREQKIPFPFAGVTDAALSPDGQRIAFSTNTGDDLDETEIWTAAESGGDARQHTSMPGLQHDPAWGHASDHLLFLSAGGPSEHDVWRLVLASGAREQLTAGTLYQFDAAPGPGESLLVSSNRSGNYDIWLETPEGEARALTRNGALDGGPSLSPDGRTLLFHSTRSGGVQIWRLDLETGRIRQLTNLPLGARGAVWWSPPRSEDD